jgi:hypothetical protein
MLLAREADPRTTYIEFKLQEVEEARFHNFKTFGYRTIRIDKSVSAIARFSSLSLWRRFPILECQGPMVSCWDFAISKTFKATEWEGISKLRPICPQVPDRLTGAMLSKR